MSIDFVGCKVFKKMVKIERFLMFVDDVEDDYGYEVFIL